MKRFVDLIVAIPSLLILLPVFFAMAVLIKLDSPGPVFYRGVRIGRLGKPFRIFKFRTMISNAEQLGGSCTADDDVRITRFGRSLRRYKLDELPQLMNVLNGTMGLVGPRPEVQMYTDLFNEEERAILTVRPGLTDWATLWDSDEGAMLRGSLNPEQTYLEKIRPEKIRLQLKYVRERNSWADLKIIFTTIALVLKHCWNGKNITDAQVDHSLGKES